MVVEHVVHINIDQCSIHMNDIWTKIWILQKIDCQKMSCSMTGRNELKVQCYIIIIISSSIM